MPLGLRLPTPARCLAAQSWRPLARAAVRLASTVFLPVRAQLAVTMVCKQEETATHFWSDRIRRKRSLDVLG